MLIVSLLAPWRAAQAATPIYVRTDGDDANCNGTADAAYPGAGGPGLNCAVQTIQQGISLVDAGGVVSVGAGTFTLAGGVSIAKSLTLQGANAGVSPNTGVRGAETILTVSGVVSPAFRVDITSAVIFDGLTFQATQTAIDSYLAATQITIRYNIFSDSLDQLTYFNSPARFTFQDNYLTNLAADEEVIFIAGNWNGSSGTVVAITDNVWEDYNAPAINLSSVSGTISGNRMTNIYYYALLLANNSGGVTISANQFDGVTNPDPGTTQTWGAGVRFYTPTFTGAVNVTNNTFTNCYVGVAMRAGGNVSGLSLHVNDNSFSSNTFNARHEGSGLWDLSRNWWGSNVPADVRSAIGGGASAEVDHTPWFDSGTDSDPGTAGFQGDYSHLWVDGLSAQTGSTPHIQEGVNWATSAGTVTIAATTYNESVSLNKSLTLEGEGSSATILDGLGVGDGITLSSGALSDVTIRDLKLTGYRYGIYKASGAMTNLTLQDMQASANSCHGIYLPGSPTTNVTVLRVNASDNGSVSCTYARGIAIWNGIKTNITIRDGVFNNNWLVGIDLNDGSATGVLIQGNTVLGNGDSGIAVLGPEGPGSTLLQGNRLTDNGRYGIEIKNPSGNNTSSGPGSIVVADNVISRTVDITDLRDLAGIVVIRRSPNSTYNDDQPSGVVIQRNQVSGYHRAPVGSTGDGFGIVFEGLNHTVISNTVAGNDIGIQVQAGNPLINQQGTEWFDRGDAASAGGLVQYNNVLSNDIGMRSVGLDVTAASAACNNFVGNSNYGFSNSFAVLFSALINWWGSPTGPTYSGNPGGVGDALTDNVDYQPWSVGTAPENCTPTAVTVAGFSVSQAGNAALIQWSTASELALLGFNLYRSNSPTGERELLNGTLIPCQACGRAESAIYAFSDTTAVPGQPYSYWLEVVGRDGGRTLLGPLSFELSGWVLYLPVVVR